MGLIRRGFVLSLVAAFGIAAPALSAHAATGGDLTWRFVAYEKDKAAATLRPDAQGAARKIAVTDVPGRDLLAKAREGDIVKFTADDIANPGQVAKVIEVRRAVPEAARLAALAASFAILWLLGAAMVGGSPLAFLIGADNRYSNSQTQMALWFAALASVYGAALVLRIVYFDADTAYIGGIGITENLLALSGLSAFSFGGAKVITSQKVQSATQQNLPSPKFAATRPNFLTDLVQNDFQQADLGDFEMILIAMVAAGVFVFKAFHFLGELQMAPTVMLPDVDTTLLASFGVGHGAYLVKKAASAPGAG